MTFRESAPTVEFLQARIAELEEENAALRAQIAKPSLWQRFKAWLASRRAEKARRATPWSDWQVAEYGQFDSGWVRTMTIVRRRGDESQRIELVGAPGKTWMNAATRQRVDYNFDLFCDRLWNDAELNANYEALLRRAEAAKRAQA
jgi:hypothetical protein